MLTEVKAYSSWRTAPTLPLSVEGRSETDLIRILNIEGLDPVNASVDTTSFATIDGVDIIGSNVASRNIVLTIGSNPDWNTWTYESLRKLLYSYFMPKRVVRLVFYSDDMVPVEIYGIVETVSDNIFSKNPECIVSIICPDPYFTALDPVVLTGQSIRPGGDATLIDYNGNIETAIRLKASFASGAVPTYIAVQIGVIEASYFQVNTLVNSSMSFELSSIPMQKFVQNVNIADGVILNKLSSIQEGSIWPTLQPGGENEFSVITDAGVQDWELTYFERFGGL